MNKFIFPVLTAGVAAFVAYSGYCAYNHARHNEVVKKYSYDMFESINQATESKPSEANKNRNVTPLSDLTTPVARRNFFMQKMKSANAAIEAGNQEEGIELIIEAMAVCSKPAALLQCMSTTFPINIYKQLIEKLSSLA